MKLIQLQTLAIDTFTLYEKVSTLAQHERYKGNNVDVLDQQAIILRQVYEDLHRLCTLYVVSKNP